MSDRLEISSGTKWEEIVGYARAVRVGAHVAVTGTTAFGADGELVGVGDPGAQTTQILHNIDRALEQAGVTRADVVRVRIYVTDIERDWEAIGRAHKAFFDGVRPATTMVQISGLVDPRMLVEIEADAIAG